MQFTAVLKQRTKKGKIKMAKKTFAELEQKLLEVPGAAEHMQKVSVILAEEIYRRRKELNLTQSQVIELAKSKGYTFTQATLSRAESGVENIEMATYNKIFDTLGGVVSLHPTYQERPKSPKLKERVLVRS